MPDGPAGLARLLNVGSSVEVKDVVGWLVTGGIGSAALLLSLLNRRDARRAARNEGEKIWSLGLSVGAARGSVGRLFAIQVHDPGKNRFRFLTARAIRPPGVVLALVDTSGKGRDVNAGAVPGEFRAVLNLAAQVGLGGGFRVFAHNSSTDSRSASSPLVIELEVEEISSARRTKRIPITSERIVWKASASASDR